MARSTITREIQVAVPPAQIWETIKDNQILAKAGKPAVVSVEVVQGGETPAVGDLRIVNFNTEIVPYPFVKEKLTFIDDASFTIGSSVVEGGLVGSLLSYQNATLKVKPDGAGSLLVWELEYESLVDSPDALEQFANGFVGSVKAIEGYVLAGN